MFRIATLCVVLYCSVASAQQVDSPQGASAVVEVIKFDFQQFYSSYSKILDKYVDLRGRVDYLKLKENHPIYQLLPLLPPWSGYLVQFSE